MSLTLFASFCPVVFWVLYIGVARLIEARRPSLSVIMSIQRRRWVANAARRQSPLDAIISGNLMSSVSFLASTSVLVILAVFTAFGQLGGLHDTLAPLALGGTYYSLGEMQVHLVVTISLFALAFFAFTLSLRQFNHFCIMLGALGQSGRAGEEEIDAVTALNSMGARNFNNGLRAYYFSVANVAWFAANWLAIIVSAMTVLFLIHREFFSSAHRIAAQATVIASREPQPDKAP
jgi:uncharacterized membrane protein